jgi:hypothetical protein
MRNDRSARVKQLLKDGNYEHAEKLIVAAFDYHEAELFVLAVLRHESAPAELLEAALEAFLDSREHRYQQHGFWVHSLSHFTDWLWERRMLDWIKRFNEVAFRGATELWDSKCSDRLIGDFARYARWDDDPADFHITPENIEWMKWKYFEDAKKRIEAAPFASEAAYISWELKALGPPTKFDYEAQTSLLDIEALQAKITRLQELGENVDDLQDLAKATLDQQVEKFTADLTSEIEHIRERAEKGLAKTHDALAKL